MQRALRMTTVSSKVTSDQHQRIAERARAKGVSVSEYIRQRVLSGLDEADVVDYCRALMAEVCSLRTILAYAVTNLAAGSRIDAAFMRDLFREADSMKAREAEVRLAQARLAGSMET